MTLMHIMYCDDCDKSTKHSIEVKDSSEVHAVCVICGKVIEYWRHYR